MKRPVAILAPIIVLTAMLFILSFFQESDYTVNISHWLFFLFGACIGCVIQIIAFRYQLENKRDDDNMENKGGEQ